MHSGRCDEPALRCAAAGARHDAARAAPQAATPVDTDRERAALERLALRLKDTSRDDAVLVPTSDVRVLLALAARAAVPPHDDAYRQGYAQALLDMKATATRLLRLRVLPTVGAVLDELRVGIHAEPRTWWEE